MGEERLLSDLCSVCYIERPKYRCPKCRTQTCSLACYKRHQQRASCTGQRDPAAYLKRSQLATANGIDQDYNYLKKVEQEIERASVDVAHRDRGTTEATAGKNVARGGRAESALQRYLNENRIHLRHAPEVMSRAKTNQTRPTHSGRIIWTVEWIDDLGMRTLRHECSASDKLVGLYGMIVRRTVKSKRKASQSASTVVPATRGEKRKKKAISKRKRLEEGEEASKAKLKCVTQSTKGGIDEKIARESPSSVAELRADAGANKGAANFPIDELPRPGDVKYQSNAPSSGHNIDDGLYNEDIEAKTELELDNSPLLVPDVSKHDHDSSAFDVQHFYLLRPSTASSSKVLIPRKPDDTLTAALRNHAVLEYPTFYVLRDGPDSLPSDFMLEEDYIRGLHEQQASHTMEHDVAKHAQPARLMSGSTEPISAQSILEMLRRDVAR